MSIELKKLNALRKTLIRQLIEKNAYNKLPNVSTPRDIGKELVELVKIKQKIKTLKQK